jgi:Beta-lactamase enzyme family
VGLPSSAVLTSTEGGLVEVGAREVGLAEVDGGEVGWQQPTRSLRHCRVLCGVVLQRYSVDDLDQVITYTSDDLADWSPVTETKVDTGMSIAELCAAAVCYSDNTATNLLLDEIGGPSVLQQALRENGDDVVSTDRYEPEMSDRVPGDTRRGELVAARSGQGRFERIRAAMSSSSLVDIWRKPLVLAISARSCWSWYGTPGGSGARCQCTCALPLLLPRLRM